MINKKKNFIDESLSDMEKAEKAKKIINEEYLERVFERILKNDAIEKLSPKIGIVLVNHAKAIIIVRECKTRAQNALNEHIKEYEKKLKENYSIRSNISVWLSECLRKERVCTN